MSDNITAVSYVNNIREITSEFCNEIAKEIFYDIYHKICKYHLYTFLEYKILRQTVFLETSMRLLSGN